MGDYTKTKNGVRDIAMNNQVEWILKEYLKKEYQPNEKNNTYFSTGQVNMVFKRFCEHYNIRYRLRCKSTYAKAYFCN